MRHGGATRRTDQVYHALTHRILNLEKYALRYRMKSDGTDLLVNGQGAQIAPAVAGGRGPPTGPAGGVLTGSYPNPGFAGSAGGAGLTVSGGGGTTMDVNTGAGLGIVTDAVAITDVELLAFMALAGAADRLPYFTASNAM